jgi:hypothetical protein
VRVAEGGGLMSGGRIEPSAEAGKEPILVVENKAAPPLRLKEGLLVLGPEAGAAERGGEVLLASRFDDAVLNTYPYRFVTASCSDTARLTDLRARLGEASFWSERSDDFFSHSEARLYPHNSDGFGWLVQDSCLRSVQRFVEECFGVPLAPDMEIVAQRMDPGNHSGFHNDSPRLGWETHRLNLYLNDDWDVARGGRLKIASKMSGDIVSRFVEPTMGQVMAFEASPNSYHAIEPVRSGERYSILYMFWHAANAPGVARAIDSMIRESRSAWRQKIAERFGALTGLLQSSGAGEIPHGTSNLMDHLLDTGCLLLAWGLPDHVGLAALLQGIDDDYLDESGLLSLGLDQALGKRAAALDDESERAALRLANLLASAPHVPFSHARWVERKRDFGGGPDLPTEPARRAARLLFDHGGDDGGPNRATQPGRSAIEPAVA